MLTVCHPAAHICRKALVQDIRVVRRWIDELQSRLSPKGYQALAQAAFLHVLEIPELFSDCIRCASLVSSFTSIPTRIGY